MDIDEVISEIGTAMENLLEKDENGFSWDLENKVKKRVLIDNDLYHLYSDREKSKCIGTVFLMILNLQKNKK